jgi:hypothetical protein
VHEVHLEEAGLQRALSGSIVLEGIEEKRGTLLNHALLHEDVHHLANVTHWRLISHEHLRKLHALLRADAHDAAKNGDVIGGESNFLGIQNNLLELARFRKAVYHLLKHNYINTV